MECPSCHQDAYTLKYKTREAKVVVVCNNCGGAKPPWVPDTFFKGPHFEEHLADQKNPQGVHVESRRHKAELMRSRGVHETGDKIHGARISKEK